MPHIRDFPASLVTIEHISGQSMKCVAGLGSALVQCYDQAIMPSEHGNLHWSARGEVIDLSAPRWSVEGESESPLKPELHLHLARRQPDVVPAAG